MLLSPRRDANTDENECLRFNFRTALLRDAEVDAWVIVSPNFRHAEQLELISNLNQPTLVEKPLCSLPQLKNYFEEEEFSFSDLGSDEHRYMPHWLSA